MKSLRKVLVLAMTMVLLCSSLVSVHAYRIGDVVNHTMYSDIVAKINGHDIASFNIDGYTAVVAEDLRNYGFTVNWVDWERALYISRNHGSSKVASRYVAPYVGSNMVGAWADSVLFTDIKTYIEGVPVSSYNIGGKTAVFFNDLACYGNISYDNSQRVLSLSVPGLDWAKTAQKGTPSNPFYMNEIAYVPYQSYSGDPVRNISVVCTNFLRGASAQAVVSAGSDYFKKYALAGQEWIFMEFYIGYSSSTGGASDKLNASSILSSYHFYTESRDQLKSHDTASLYKNYKDLNVYEVSLYPGGASRVVFAYLVDEGLGDIYLHIPSYSNNREYFINCSKSGYSHSSAIAPSPYIERRGSLVNPYYANDGAVIPFKEYKDDPVRNVSITCTNILRGYAANPIIMEGNSYNKAPNAGQEWVFMEFNINYISSSAGAGDKISAYRLISTSDFCTDTNPFNYIKYSSTASFSNGPYKSFGNYSVELVPGTSSKVVIGILFDSIPGDIYLKVPTNDDYTTKYINCSSTTY